MVLEVAETIASVWNYHLRRFGEKAALCGRTDIMPTRIPLSAWGIKSGHLPESYCPECDKAKDKES